MTVTDFVVTERPGERTKAAPNGMRVSMNRDYTTDLIRRLTEQLAEKTGDIQVVMFGEMLED